MEHIKAYSKENPNATFDIDDIRVVDLFPYKVKNRNLFYFRDHPENLHPESMGYRAYWEDTFLPYCIEGRWVLDDNGIWVYTPPKLFYYVNYAQINDTLNNRWIHPDLCDLEWIHFTYFLCIDGFSGFSDDDKYTCNYLIERYEKSNDKRFTPEEREIFELNEIESANLPKECYSKETGKLKKFIDPWTYLTRTYLIDDPRGPLGKALYQNPRSNGFILGARGIRKSYSVYVGDFMHEWTFGGITDMNDIDKVNNRKNFAMGSGSSDQMQRTINNISAFYDSQPGKYKFDSLDVNDWMGPYYKNYQGTFKVGKEVQHVIKGKNNVIELLGSTCQISAIRPDRTKIVAGDRFRRVYIEEVGFLEYIEEVFSSNIDSLRLGPTPVGSWIATGTGGDMVAIKGSKKMYENPKGFDIFSIPYYWKNPDKRIGLFIPAQYQYRNFDDGNGFIYLDLATKAVKKERGKWARELDSVNIASRMMYNPVKPDEMLIPNELSILPKKEAQLRLSEIDAHDLNSRVLNVGYLEYDQYYPHGVKFEKDLKNKLTPIETYDADFTKINREGAFCMYEPPPFGKVPKNMFWVIYDPAGKSGEGTSLHSVLVYKHFLSKDGKTWTDTIVAEWIGRKLTLEQNYDFVIRIAKFYNAKIFPEINVAGFVEWCKVNNYMGMLQRDSYELQKEVSPGSKRSYYRAGFQMTGRMKWWALQRFSDWLLEVRRYDIETGIPILRNIDFIYSKRLLNEIIYYNETDNFDHISSALGLMILLGQLDKFLPSEEEEIDEDEWKQPVIYKEKVITRRRSLLENFL